MKKKILLLMIFIYILGINVFAKEWCYTGKPDTETSPFRILTLKTTINVLKFKFFKYNLTLRGAILSGAFTNCGKCYRSDGSTGDFGYEYNGDVEIPLSYKIKFKEGGWHAIINFFKRINIGLLSKVDLYLVLKSGKKR